MRDFLQISHVKGTLSKTPPKALPNGSELAATRRRHDDDTTTTRRRTRRRHDENKANTLPTPDPNYKREPFATHSGKRCACFLLQPSGHRATQSTLFLGMSLRNTLYIHLPALHGRQTCTRLYWRPLRKSHETSGEWGENGSS